jgi:tRNA (guanine37-N1)-methyltransferase
LGARKQVDDTPYGGGDGMLLKPEPVVTAIEFAIEKSQENMSDERRAKSEEDQRPLVLLPTPRGKLYKQSDAKRLASGERDLIIVCPRYEGYDERIVTWVDEQVCIGNFVLTGGELPAMVIADSIVRLLPGVLGGEHSVAIESFQDDDKWVEFPQYTRPEEFRGRKVPEVLLSGHHTQIEKWRTSQSNKHR